MIWSWLIATLAVVGDGGAGVSPPAAVLQPGEILLLEILFQPAAATTVTGLDACLDFDPAVFDDPTVTAHFITAGEMTDFSFGNGWPGHPDSYHYERIALMGDTGWEVDATPHAVYSISFPVKSDAAAGDTVIAFTPGFITFSDAEGELLDPLLIEPGTYTIGPVATPTPAVVPTTGPAALLLLLLVLTLGLRRRMN